MIKTRPQTSADFKESHFISLLQAGNERAMHTLFQEHKRGLFYFSYQITRNRPESEDIVTDSFIKYCVAKTYYSTLLEIKNFLYLAVKHASINYLRTQANRTRLLAENVRPFLQEFEPDVSVELVKTELVAIFHQALEQLNPTQRLIIEEFIKGNKSAKEIANQLNITEVNAWQIRSRSLKIMKAYVSANYPGEYILVILLTILELAE